MDYPITYNVEGGSIDIQEVSLGNVSYEWHYSSIQYHVIKYNDIVGYNIVANHPFGYALDHIDFTTIETFDSTWSPRTITTTITESSYSHRGFWRIPTTDPYGNQVVQIGPHPPATYKSIDENHVSGFHPHVDIFTGESVIYSIDVYWRKKDYEVKTGVSPEDKGTSSGDGFYDENETATISTERKSKLWKFSHWADDKGNTYDNESFTHTVTDDIEFTAYYERVKGDILCDENDVIVSNLQGEILHGDP